MMVFKLMDTESVINEVRVRECLWNPRNVYYKNKMDKHKAWAEVCRAVVPKYSSCTKDDKWRIVRAVQSRWKTARDAYMKCRITDARKPTYRARSHKYIYYDILTFLESTKDCEDEVSNKAAEDVEEVNRVVDRKSVSRSTFEISDDDAGEVSDEVMDFEIDIHDDFKDQVKDIVTEEVSADVINDVIDLECLPGTSSQSNDQKDPLATGDITVMPKTVPRKTRRRQKKNSMSEFETRLLKIMRLKNNTNSSALQEDDQCFFNSLAPLINSFNMYQKLTLRSKILELVMEVGNVHSVGIKQEPETCVIDEIGDSK